MLFSDISPFVRFAEIIHCASAGDPVYVRDCRIFYVLSGQAQLRIDNQVYSLLPHCVFYCSSGNRYTFSTSGIQLISINFDLTQENRQRELPYAPVVLTEGVSLPQVNICPVADQELLNRHIFLPNGIACREWMDKILEEFATRRVLYRETANALLRTLLSQLLRSSMESATQSAKAVDRIIDYIRTHYPEPMSNALFSQLTGYHEYYLNRLFTKHTGSTIRHYILDVRISHAKKMLLNTDDPLSVIAEKVGFNSNTYFSSYFRQTTGLSPARFRKKYKNAL